jgi:hypothetical protein
MGINFLGINFLGIKMASYSQTYRPKARFRGLDIEELNGEIVVYDRTSDQVHLLSASTAKIWHLCDGKRRTVDIVDALKGPEASIGMDSAGVDSALSELEAIELLDLSEEADASRASVNLSRRSMLAHAAGASAFAASIVTLQAPAVASIFSEACTNVNDCIERCPSAKLKPDGPCVCTTTNELQCSPDICKVVADRIDLNTCGCGPATGSASNPFCTPGA